MITVEQMAKVIEDKLNSAAEDMPFKFLIHASVGDYNATDGGTQRTKAVPLINGIIQSLPSSIVPLQSVKSHVTSQILSFIVPTQPNSQVDNGITLVLSAIQTFVEEQAGFAGNLDDESANSFSYILAPQLPQVGRMSNDIGFWYVPITVSLTWQFIAGGITSNQILVKVDGSPVILIEGGFARSRIAETNSKDNNEEMVSVITQQGLTLRCVSPFIKGSVGATFVRDMLIGDLSKSYTVEYDDGITKNDDGTNPVFEMVATDVSENIAAGTVVSVAVTLVIASEDTETQEG